MDNLYLDRSDTNNIEESNFKANFFHQAGENTTVKTTLLFSDIDNGYDAFSLDVNRNTYSDQPGHDRQQTRAASWIVNHKINESYALKATLSFANSDVEYGYDEDWSYEGLCDDFDCIYDGYSSTDHYIRDNNNQTLDLLVKSNQSEADMSWSLGLYARNQQVDLTRQYTYASNDFNSEFDTESRAIYGQVTYPIIENLKLTTGLRFEKRKAHYIDNNSFDEELDENFVGGNMSLTYSLMKNLSAYGLISRGYKAGGFNAAPELTAEQNYFDAEYLWNYEAGVKSYWPEEALSLNFSIFSMQREDAQEKKSFTITRDNNSTQFVDYINNTSRAESLGLELEFDWSTSEILNFYGSLAVLQAEFTQSEEEDNTNSIDLSGRDLAHAPNYQLVFGSKIFFSDNLYLNPELQAKDSFYASSSHLERIDSYELLNIRLGYELNQMKFIFYINNVANKEIQTRGFGDFGNDPRDGYLAKPYYQFAAPRVIGLSASMEF
jgi:outer membrane receptor protein involved in Fe transport